MTKASFYWELRSCAYYAEFEKPKIVYPRYSAVPLQLAMKLKGTLWFRHNILHTHERSFFSRYSK